ncbi:hypothetical protein SELMODRAFT_415998 [Selaginella moellendorffii]|uniref:Uncharacterized protein n=1 Tax=Selaginella moellendorffii TaxID=88036 RepID=D8RXR7_SELML|nr:hypothetical protein SELMODRAFT_415998 [Selaginella moellendorffii]
MALRGEAMNFLLMLEDNAFCFESMGCTGTALALALLELHGDAGHCISVMQTLAGEMFDSSQLVFDRLVCKALKLSRKFSSLTTAEIISKLQSRGRGNERSDGQTILSCSTRPDRLETSGARRRSGLPNGPGVFPRPDVSACYAKDTAPPGFENERREDRLGTQGVSGRSLEKGKSYTVQFLTA